jgi:hypothetical protein
MQAIAQSSPASINTWEDLDPLRKLDASVLIPCGESLSDPLHLSLSWNIDSLADLV